MMRSSAGMNPDKIFSRVVLPAPVPPETSTFSRPLTIACKTRATSEVNEPKPTKSSTESNSTAKRRIESIGPSIASGGMIALTREPSFKRASTIGDDSSMRRPTAETMRSMMFNRC